MKRDLICILCPRGCSMKASIAGSEIRVEGNSCPRGEKYAIEELIHPMRHVTAVVRIGNRLNRAVSVKTEKPVPKEKVLELASVLQKTKVTAPITFGEPVLKDVFGTNVIATGEVI